MPLSHSVPFVAVLNLNTPSSVKSSTDCANYDKGPDAVLIRLYSNLTDSCYNLDSVFSPNQDDLDFHGNYVADTCNPINTNCTNDYEASILPNYSPDANYSFTRFQMGTTGFWGARTRTRISAVLRSRSFPRKIASTVSRSPGFRGADVRMSKVLLAASCRMA